MISREEAKIHPPPHPAGLLLHTRGIKFTYLIIAYVLICSEVPILTCLWSLGEQNNELNIGQR